MPTQEFVVRVVQVGANQTARSLQMIGASATRATAPVNNLSAALRGVAAFFVASRVASSLADTVDAFTRLRAQVGQFASTSEEARTSFTGLMGVAERSRSSLEAVGQVYQRFSVALRDTGSSAEEVLRITETLVKSSKLAGATAQEAVGAFRQLAQGLGGNRLSGQELNSVLEQLFPVAKAIAKELDAPVGQLRALANRSGEAKINTEVLKAALADLAKTVDQQFSNLPITFEDAFVSLRRGTALAFGALGEASGISNAFAGAINSIGVALGRFALDEEKVRAASVALKEALLVVATAALPALAAAIARVGLSLVTLFANPIGIVALALAGAAAAVLRFRDELIPFLDEVESRGGVFGRIAGFIADMLRWVDKFNGDNLLAFFTKVDQSAKPVEKVDKAIESLLRRFREAQGEYAALAGASTEFERSIAEVENSITGVTNDFTKLVDKGKITEEEFLKFKNTVAEVKFREFTDGVKELLSELDPAIEVTKEYESRIERLNYLLGLGEISLHQFVEATSTAGAEMAEALRQIEVETAKGLSTIGVGLKDALINVRDDIGSSAQAISDGFVSAFRIGTDALNEFLTTGKFDFKDFARSLIMETQKVLTQLLVLAALRKVLGSAVPGGGIVSGVVSGAGSIAGTIPGRAAGGPVNAGQAYTVGERGRELFVPPTTGQIVPLDGMQAPQVNVQVVNVTDPREVTNALSTREGEQAILNIISRNRGRVSQAIGG